MFTINRTGQFKVSTHTNNQCKSKNHVAGYKYHIIIVVDTLDEQGFVIDHIEIDNIIQNIKIEGSCEEICLQLFNSIKKLKCAGTIVAYKSIIQPITANMQAFIEYKWYNDQYNDAKFWLSTI